MIGGVSEPTTAPAIPPDTRTITLLFTDIEGSTRLWERFPEAMKGSLRRHDAILREAIESAGGAVVKTTGDGMMAVFERASDAAAAALETQRGLAAEAWVETGALLVRMGLHAGEAEVRGGDYFGPTVNRTARIMAAGHGGQVLLSASAAALVRDGLPDGADLLDLGEHRLKDLGRPEQVFQLTHPDLDSTFPPLVTVRPFAARLPVRTAALVGRDAELGELRRRLADPAVRLVTLTGPGGTGKTTLALRVAEDLAPTFRDGVAFVDLSSARDTAAALVLVARAVGLDDVIDRPLEEELRDRLQGRQLLLVLDNFEQVIEAATAVAGLLAACTELTVLASSREPLHVRAEHVLPVPPLGLPPADVRPTADRVAASAAVQLFVDRATAVRPDFELTDDNAPAVAEICRRLDGLPLAIELAAARLRLFSPEVLRERLGDRLGLLRSGPRDLPERQQALRATMDWSYELLEPGERRLFELLAVFAEADIAAIEAVVEQVRAGGSRGPDEPPDRADGDDGDLDPDVLDGLAGLVDKSLVRKLDGAHGEPRMTMLETIREFATDRLERRPELAARARDAHATHYADLARQLHDELQGRDDEAAIATLTADVANLRIAWAHWVAARDLERLDDMADTLLALDDRHGWYFDTVELTTGMLAVLEASETAPDRVDREIDLRVTLARALMATKGFTPEVDAALSGALELFERGASTGRQYAVLRGLALLYQFRAQHQEATGLGQTMLAIGEREQDPRMLIAGHLVVGTTGVFLGDVAGGLEHLGKAIDRFAGSTRRARMAAAANDPRVACHTTSAFGLWLLGFPDRAVEQANAALALAAELDHPFSTAYARFHSGLLHHWRREWEVVHERAIGLLEVAAGHDFRIWEAIGLCLLGASRVGLGRAEEGLVDIRSGMDRYQGLKSPPVFWPLLRGVEADAALRAGRPADGLGPVEEGLAMLGAGDGTNVLPEFQLLKGDLVLAAAADETAGRAEAEPWYRLALEGATERKVPMARLRAATRLARIRLAEGQPETAASLLSDVYAGFTEGFETADLREARELLEAPDSD
jgi:predicted ATPase/class 3 adenylate cyclase